MDKFDKKHEKAKEIFEKYKEANLEEKVISLAKKAAKSGFYDESIGLLDNLLLLQAKNSKEISQLAVKTQIEKEKNSKKLLEK